MIAELLARAIEALIDGRASADPDDAFLWDALDEAIANAEEYQDALESLGLDGLKDLVASLVQSMPLKARLQLISGATSFEELTADATADAQALDADTQRRRSLRERRIEFVMKTGEVGLKLLLKFIV